MQNPVFIIVGLPQHGKSTIRNSISAMTALKGGSCSDAIYQILAKKKGVTVEELKKVDKETLRPELIALGDWLCGVGELAALNGPHDPGAYYRGPSALVRMLFFSGIRVIDGVRRRLELQETLKHLEWCGVQTLIIFVERPGAPVIKDNTEDLKEFADVVFVNDGTAEELCKKVEAQLFKWFPQDPPVVVEAK